MKPWWKSKIVLLNLSATLVGGAVSLLPQLHEVLTPAVYGWSAVVLGLANIALRFITSQPIGRDQP